MTTYIPQITIPHQIFANAAASVLLPIALGTGVGFSTRRKQSQLIHSPTPTKPIARVPRPVLMRQPRAHPANRPRLDYTASKTQETYRLMKQPPLRPPPSVFGPAWTTLYGLMGYAAHRAITTGLNPLTSSVEGVRDAKHAATLYTIQLGLNLAWMPLFFGMRRPVAALVDIVALLGVNSYLTYQFFQMDTVAGWCFVPYVTWLTFATYLNTGVGVMNNWRITDEDLLKKRNE